MLITLEFFHVKTIFFYFLSSFKFCIIPIWVKMKAETKQSDLEMVSRMVFRNAWILYLRIWNCPPLQTPSIKPILILAKWESNFIISLPGTAVWQVQQEPVKTLGSIIPLEHNGLFFFLFGNPYYSLMVISKPSLEEMYNQATKNAFYETPPWK